VSAYRAIAATLLTTSLALALLRDGPSFGSLLWATTISLAALALAFMLAWRPGWFRGLTVFGRRGPRSRK